MHHKTTKINACHHVHGRLWSSEPLARSMIIDSMHLYITYILSILSHLDKPLLELVQIRMGTYYVLTLSCISTLEPCCSSISTTFVCPRLDADIRAVHPSYQLNNGISFSALRLNNETLLYLGSYLRPLTIHINEYTMNFMNRQGRNVDIHYHTVR